MLQFLGTPHHQSNNKNAIDGKVPKDDTKITGDDTKIGVQDTKQLNKGGVETEGAQIPAVAVADSQEKMEYIDKDNDQVQNENQVCYWGYSWIKDKRRTIIVGI